MRSDGAPRLGSFPIGSKRGGAILMDGPNLVLDLAQIRSDARSGKLSIEQLLDIIENSQQTIQRLEVDKRRLTQRLAQYEPEAARESTSATNPPTPNASYSVDAENQRRQGRRRRKKSPGRTPTELKFAEA